MSAKIKGSDNAVGSSLIKMHLKRVEGIGEIVFDLLFIHLGISINVFQICVKCDETIFDLGSLSSASCFLFNTDSMFVKRDLF